jgi:hypothetical protein
MKVISILSNCHLAKCSTKARQDHAIDLGNSHLACWVGLNVRPLTWLYCRSESQDGGVLTISTTRKQGCRFGLFEMSSNQ